MLQFAILFFISNLISALPAPSPLSIIPRACTTVIPTYHHALSNLPLQSTNLQIQANSLFSSKSFLVSEDYTNATNPTQSLQLLSFAIPSNAYGCQLSITDSARTLNHSLPIPTLNIISLRPNSFPDVPNENTTVHTLMTASPSLIETEQFGTIKMEMGGEAVINSQLCPEEVEVGCGVGYAQFVVEFLDLGKREEGGKAWWMVGQSTETDTDSEAAGWDGVNGLFMTFNC